MRISWCQEDNVLTFAIELGADDHSEASGQHDNITLDQHMFRFVLPQRQEMHPDLLAAALLTVVQPFAGRQIEMPLPVSVPFADAVRQAFNLELSPVSPQLEQRMPGSRPGLAFSGGTDSLASMMLMPEDAALVFAERIAHPHTDVPADFNTYSPQGAVETFKALERRSGRRVHRVKTDHEYIIGPYPDWATWIGLGAPLVLMAEVLDLDSIWFGAAIGSIYLPEWNDLRYFSWDDEDESWQRVMTAVGIPIARPVSGMSELGTRTIVEASPYADLSISCGNGQNGNPCMLCHKCLRRLLIQAVLRGFLPDKTTLQQFAEQPAVQKQFSEEVMWFTMAYCLTRLPLLPNLYFSRIQEAVQSIAPDVSFVERWYPRSLEHIPVRYRSDFLARKSQYLLDSTAKHIEQIESWEPIYFTAPEPGPGEKLVNFGRRVVRGAGRRLRRYGDKVFSAAARTAEGEHIV